MKRNHEKHEISRKVPVSCPLVCFVVLAVVALLVGGLFLWRNLALQKVVESPVPSRSQSVPKPAAPTAGERLLEGYADPASPPIEDLRKLHRVLTGYFSVVKNPSRNPIGGNADLAAALRGENPNRTVFVPSDHTIFSPDGLLLDRWNTPVIVHPEGWRRIELRSAGPDKTPYTADDLILAPSGLREK
jgi:hypothetical protein